MIFIPDEFNESYLTWLIENWEIWIHLYVVDVPISRSTVQTDLIESAAPGYAPVLAENWTDPVILARRGQIEADWIKFVRLNGDPAQQAFGYYATAGETGNAWWVERFEPAPIPFASSSDFVWVQPRYSRRAEKRRLSTGL